MLKKILSLIIFILVCCTAYLLYKTVSFKTKQINFTPVKKIDVSDSAIFHLAESVRIKTISTQEPSEFDSAQFQELLTFLKKTYPSVEQRLEKTVINDFSVIYKWNGQDEMMKPIILTAHMDVVPVPKEDLMVWTVPPFSGEIKADKVWGRGTMDDKVSVIGILEAVEQLVKEDYKPTRTIYLAFGHDEEVGGLHGAQSIAAYLKSINVKPEFVLDEGYSITQGLVPGVLTDVALIGIAEKGFASIELSIDMDGGHSSMPHDETAIEIIARAITRLENNPFPAKITEPVQKFLEYVGPEMRFQEKIVFANNKLFKSAIIGTYQKSAPGNAVVQTTMVPTVFNSGIKENVIPSSASAIINFRLLPGTTTNDVIHHVKKAIQDSRIKAKLMDYHSEPSKISSTNTMGYSILNQSIKEIYPEVITVPNLVIAATDGRYYGEICDNVYRFLPIRLTPDNINAMHGINENIPVEDFQNAIRFYIQLIKNYG